MLALCDFVCLGPQQTRELPLTMIQIVIEFYLCK